MDRTDKPIEVSVIETRAENVERGDIRVDGKWIAGWHFNGALFRIAAVYHRLLKLANDDLASDESRKKLLPKVQLRYREWTAAEWSSENADCIYTEVNTLKHAPEGVHHRRTVTFTQAVNAVQELVVLVEAWRNKPQRDASLAEGTAPPNSA